MFILNIHWQCDQPLLSPISVPIISFGIMILRFCGELMWHNLKLVKTTERKFMVGFGYSLSLMHFVFSARAHSWYYDL